MAHEMLILAFVKKSLNRIILLIVLLGLGLQACAPHSREQNKETAKTPDTVVINDGNKTDDKDDSTDVVVDKTLKTGDIIFHKSQSKQSKAILEASGSEWSHVGILIKKDESWFVAEAIGPVVLTPLQDFINRGKNKDYKIFRYKYFDANTMTEGLVKAIEKQNKSYDIYFEFSDDKTYCSELVYKAMLEVTGHELGHVQKFKDLKLSGPYVTAMIKKRLTDQGRVLNVEESIITPVSQMNDPQLTLIDESLNNDITE